jgi:HlyD family secretion protein
MKKKVNKKIYWLIGIALIVLAVILYFVISAANAQKKAVANLQTVKIEKSELTAIVGATGTVRANQSAVLSWQTNGRVGEINVQVGEHVADETVLASLLESSLPQSVILAKADLVTAQKNLDDLLNSNLSEAQAQLNLADAKDAYDKARWNTYPSSGPRSTDQNQIDAAQAAVTIAQAKVDKALEYYNRCSEAADDDPMKASALSTLANARQNLEKTKKDLSFLTQSANTKELAISDGEIAVAQAKYEDAKREWERLQDGPDPKDIEAAKARVTALEATIGLAQITAPFAGTVTDVNSMIGDQVAAGTVSCRIDDLSKLLVDVQVPEVDINRIQVGQNVDLTFDAITTRSYQGRVTEVARVGTEAGGIVNFDVTIEILNPDDQVLPGMTAAVNVIVNQLEGVLTVPNRAVRLVDNKQVIYLLKNNVPTKVEITIGASSDTVSEIASGNVKVGDVVVLNPPSSVLDLTSQGGPPF